MTENKIVNLDVIYCPSGKALEYASRAVNVYKGCTHECNYCFGPGCTFKTKEGYFAGANPKKNIINRVKKDIEKLSRLNDVPEILLSFIDDPYQHEEMELGLTREIIKMLIAHNLPFTILTKGGSRAVRDFDLMSSYPKSRFGTSLVFTEQASVDIWEPRAASVEERINTIAQAHEMEIKTWVSMEPVIVPKQAIDLVNRIHSIVDHWKVGKINHNKAVEKSVDWLKFRREVTSALTGVNADFYLKKSLTEL
ncbi:Radical SAM domain protein [Desulfamplus magnetovallimortis]|uniref:Radical SAM domain protein n=1 Tax=Desulfamplus magnetovallimortis TaxID=1246637 RepID=A0A1W1HBA0_9BACT|nr:radical SAM protein [Desulfamplus magnetovallimortis]SLM29781.1 Radical SAM domain protein [Desulfamplus magnetovallimortis]